jgi:hypothetical protein
MSSPCTTQYFISAVIKENVIAWICVASKYKSWQQNHSPYHEYLLGKDKLFFIICFSLFCVYKITPLCPSWAARCKTLEPYLKG